MKVLVVDDDPDQLLLRGMLLRESGFETLEEKDVISALHAAATYKPECAILDLRLPTEQVGLALIRDLKTLDPIMRIFVLTGADPGRFARQPERTLVDDLLLKGSPFADVIQKLRAVARQIRVSHRHLA